jgi:GxxExxY protein
MAAYAKADSDLAALFSKHLELGDPAASASSSPVPAIADLSGLDAHLPGLCSGVFAVLTSRQCEATYQRCLALDLEEAGVEVASEVSMHLTYKGRRVGTRRADLIVRTTADEGVAVLELKAVASGLASDHLRQLEFYMCHMGIDVGYLINFPHDAGFPSVVSSDSDVGCGGGGSDPAPVFQQTALLGSAQPLSDRATRGKHATSTVQIVKLVRLRNQHDAAVAAVAASSAAAATAAAAHAPLAPGTARATGTRVLGVTQKGTPCKVCIREGGFCSMHAYQQK